MGYSEYHARDWAANETNEAIREEIKWCDERYYKPYPWNGTETAQNTIIRIQTLKTILEERNDNNIPSR